MPSYEQNLNDFYNTPSKGLKSDMDRYRDYQSDTKISVNKEEPDIEEIFDDENEEREE